ncbi:hypothetical protein Tco_1103692 [Tanacetum coccineum]
MFTRLFRSDDKFSQMLNKLESQPEYGVAAGVAGAGMMSQEMMRTTARMRTMLGMLGKPSSVPLNCLTETMWVRRYRPGMLPGKESHSSFSVPLIPGDMSLGKPILSDMSPGKPRICPWG